MAHVGDVTILIPESLSSPWLAVRASSWMRWNPERTSRTNQDHQREREESSMRMLVKHLTKRHRLAAQRQQSNVNGQTTSPKAVANQTRFPGSSQWAPGSVTPPGGLFLRLEQDWRETHIAYLQHRSVTAHAAHSVSTSSSSPNLKVVSGIARPNSAASMKSARYARAAAMHR